LLPVGGGRLPFIPATEPVVEFAPGQPDRFAALPELELPGAVFSVALGSVLAGLLGGGLDWPGIGAAGLPVFCDGIPGLVDPGVPAPGPEDEPEIEPDVPPVAAPAPLALPAAPPEAPPAAPPEPPPAPPPPPPPPCAIAKGAPAARQTDVIKVSKSRRMINPSCSSIRR
jgi:hypothetical protein